MWISGQLPENERTLDDVIKLHVFQSGETILKAMTEIKVKIMFLVFFCERNKIRLAVRPQLEAGNHENNLMNQVNPTNWRQLRDSREESFSAYS